MTLGDRLREAKEERGLTSVALAAVVGCHSATITHWEQGRSKPKYPNVLALAGALGVSPEWLHSGRGPREPQTGRTATPVGPDALEIVLYEYEWPDVPIDVVNGIITELRQEATTPSGRDRPASAWRLRVRQLLRERESGRHKRRAASDRT